MRRRLRRFAVQAAATFFWTPASPPAEFGFWPDTRTTRGPCRAQSVCDGIDDAALAQKRKKS